MNRILVAGLGNEMRGDDAAGLLAARALRAIGLAGVDVEEHSGDVVALAESMARHDEVVVVDAMAVDAPPGTVVDLDLADAAARTRSSSHGLGVAEALALARVLEPGPATGPRVRLIGIAASQFGIGMQPSVAVRRAAGEVAQRLGAELKESATCV